VHGCCFVRVVCINAKLYIWHGNKHVLQTIKRVIFYNNFFSYSNKYRDTFPTDATKLFYCRLDVNTVVAAEPATQPERRLRCYQCNSSVFEERLISPRFIRTKRFIGLGWFPVWWGICAVLSDKERHPGHFTSRMASIASFYVILLWSIILLVDEFIINSWFCQVSHGVDAAPIMLTCCPSSRRGQDFALPTLSLGMGQFFTWRSIIIWLTNNVF